MSLKIAHDRAPHQQRLAGVVFVVASVVGSGVVAALEQPAIA